MSESKTLGERIDLLETRLAFQDETIETLNKTITAQWLKIDALTRQLANLSERLQEAEAHAPGAGQRAAAALLAEVSVAHGFIANQIASATIAITTTAHITGVTRFELPLRGESLAA